MSTTKRIIKRVLSLTWDILRVLGQFLSADEHREGVPTIVGLMHLPYLHCIIHQIVVDDLCVHVCVCEGGGGEGMYLDSPSYCVGS